MTLDAIANAIGGVNTRLGAAAHRYVTAAGGTGDATVIGGAVKAPASFAAYANTRLGDALDASDTFMSVHHIGTPTVLTALSLVDVKGCSGRDLTTAIAVGMEVGCRIGAAAGPPAVKTHVAAGEPPNIRGGRMPASELAAAVAAARLLGLSEREMRYSLAIAGATAPVNATRWGLTEVLPDQKYQDYGLCGQGAVDAALRSAAGMTTHPAILDGEWGLWRLRGAASCDFDLMTADLGRRWLSLDNTYKPWPSCRWTHHTLTLFQHVLLENDLRPEEIDRVNVRCHPYGVAPYFRNVDPVGMVSCLFNHPHGIAMLALGVPAGPWWYLAANLGSPEVRALRRKVEVDAAPTVTDIEKWFVDGQVRRLPSSVRVHARGRTFESEGDYARGDPFTRETTLSEEDVYEKLLYMGSPHGPRDSEWTARASRLRATVAALDGPSDPRRLTELLTADALRVAIDPSELGSAPVP